MTVTEIDLIRLCAMKLCNVMCFRYPRRAPFRQDGSCCCLRKLANGKAPGNEPVYLESLTKTPVAFELAKVLHSSRIYRQH